MCNVAWAVTVEYSPASSEVHVPTFFRVVALNRNAAQAGRLCYITCRSLRRWSGS